MDKEILQKETSRVLKQSFLEKQSRFLKSWRERWVVLTDNYIFTFKERRVYKSPTECIRLKEVVAIKSTEEELDKNFSFKVQTSENTFYFCASSGPQKEAWIGTIGKAMVKSANMYTQ